MLQIAEKRVKRLLILSIVANKVSLVEQDMDEGKHEWHDRAGYLARATAVIEGLGVKL